MSELKKYILLGAAGYVAPRHLQAIKANNGNLIAAMDPNDSVGVLDNFFPNTAFFNSFERLERFVAKQQNSISKIDYLSICSPNHLHDTHCRFGLNYGMDAICEKPLVLNTWNLDALQKAESQSNNKIYNILQLRLHPIIQQLKAQVDSQPSKRYRIQLDYFTARGPWYNISWKGNPHKSGGLITNIGIHFFDMLLWIFGKYQKHNFICDEALTKSGELILEHADIAWTLSIDQEKLINKTQDVAQRTYREIVIDGQKLNFTQGFEDLHTESYKKILAGQGFSTQDVRPVIELMNVLKN